MSDRIDLSSEFLEPVSPRDNRMLTSDLIIHETNTQSPSSNTAPVELSTRTMDCSSAPAPGATSRANSGLVRAEGVGDELSDVDDQNPNDSSGSGGGSGNGSGPEPDPSPAVERTEEAAQTNGIGGSGFATGQSAGGTGTGLANRLVIVRHNRSMRALDPSLFRPMVNLERRLKRSSLYDIGPPTPEPPPRALTDDEAAQRARDTAAWETGRMWPQPCVRETIREESNAMARESENAGNGGRRASKRVTICEVARAEPPNGSDAHNRADQRPPRTSGFIVPARFHFLASGVPPDNRPTHYPAYQPGTCDIIRRVQLKLRYGTRSISLRPDNRSGTQYLLWRVVEGATWGRSTIGWAGQSSHMPISEGKRLLEASGTRPSETLQYLVDVRKDLIHAGQGL